MRKLLVGGLIWAWASTGLASDNYFECGDWAAIERGPEGLSAVLGEAAQSCRRADVRDARSLDCEFEPPRSAFGMLLRGASATLLADGSRRLSLNLAPSRARAVGPIESRLGLRFERSEPIWIANDPEAMERRYALAERDDGITQLYCQLAASSADGVPGASIVGRLELPALPQSPTRVCALPADESLPRRCVELAAGVQEFRIDGLVQGEYYLASYALQDNPGQWVAAHARRLRDCPQGESDCIGALLLPLQTRQGEVISGVLIDQVFHAVPTRVARIREAD